MNEIIDDLSIIIHAGKVINKSELVNLAGGHDECTANRQRGGGISSTRPQRRIHRSEPMDGTLGKSVFERIKLNRSLISIELGELPDDSGFSVRVNGSDIPLAQRDRMLQAGIRTSDTRTRFGLHIVEQIANARGWNFRACEWEAGGAWFVITRIDRHLQEIRTAAKFPES